jgi:hypothetical protein
VAVRTDIHPLHIRYCQRLLWRRKWRFGKGHGRFYILNLAEGSRMRSGVLDHDYSFSLEEAEAWLDAYPRKAKAPRIGRARSNAITATATVASTRACVRNRTDGPIYDT